MERLVGALVNEVVRDGDVVRRRLLMPIDRSFGEAVLRTLEAAGFESAPRFLGHDDDGAQVLSWVEGTVRSGLGAFDDAVTEVLRRVRRFHDLVPGVCHHDLAPRNTVWRADGSPVFIDWDLCGPGRPIEDVAHVCWQFFGLGPERAVGVVAPLVRAAADAYGLDAEGREVLVDEVAGWQERCADGIEQRAAAGWAPMRVLVERGAVEEVREARAWVLDHRRELTAALG